MELVINFSGGKDSTAMLAYLCETYPAIKKHVVFADTGWEHTDAEEWSRKIVAMFGLELHVVRNKQKDFFSMVEKRKMFPGMNERQCTSDLKRDPIASWIKQNVKDSVVINCLGIRSEESPKRSKMKKLCRDKRMCNGKRTVWTWHPIKEWTENQVWHYLFTKELPAHPAYQYLRRFSCQVCIFMTKHDLSQVAIHNPAAIERVSEMENKIGFTMFRGGPIKEIIK